jgi:hypothetical protein
MLAQLKEDIDAYVQDKSWYWYVPIWLCGVYVFFALLRFDPNGNLPLVILVPQSFDFVLHEFAHIFTAFLPALITAAAGSFSELMLGSVLVFIALKQKSYIALLTCCLWFMLACQSVGVYMADARAQKLSLVSLGGALSGSDKVIHDWNFVFGQLHLLSWDRFIGNSVRAVGGAVGLAGLLFTAWLIYKMAATQLQAKRERAKAQLKETLAQAAKNGTDTGYGFAPQKPGAHTGGTAAIYPDATKGVASNEPEDDTIVR